MIVSRVMQCKARGGFSALGARKHVDVIEYEACFLAVGQCERCIGVRCPDTAVGSHNQKGVVCLFV